MSEYTIGEIHRRGLLLNSQGEPYKDKASVSNRLKNQPYTSRLTPHGTAKYYTDKVIQNLNGLWNDIGKKVL